MKINLSEKVEQQIKEDLENALTIEQNNDRVTRLKKEAEGIEVLSILIATTKDRRFMFNTLVQEFNRQIEMFGYKGKGKETWKVKIPVKNEQGELALNEDGSQKWHLAENAFKHPDKVEIVFKEDDREMILGDKRNLLLDQAKGKYIVFFDSDDFPKPNYVQKIMQAIEKEPDCIGFKIAMTTNGKQPETCIHSLNNKEWTHDGKNYLRNVTHFNPVKKELAVQARFPSLRFGEDKVYSDRVSALCKTEEFIDEFLFDYRYNTSMSHDLKYGFNLDAK